MSGPHSYWKLTISKKDEKRHGSVPSSSHTAELSYPSRSDLGRHGQISELVCIRITGYHTRDAQAQADSSAKRNAQSFIGTSTGN
jgi:hypothetical protein